MKLHRRGDKSFLCVRSGSLCNQDALDTLAEEISTSWSKMHNNYWQCLKVSRNTHCMYASKTDNRTKMKDVVFAVFFGIPKKNRISPLKQTTSPWKVWPRGLNSLVVFPTSRCGRTRSSGMEMSLEPMGGRSVTLMLPKECVSEHSEDHMFDMDTGSLSTPY